MLGFRCPSLTTKADCIQLNGIQRRESSGRFQRRVGHGYGWVTSRNPSLSVRFALCMPCFTYQNNAPGHRVSTPTYSMCPHEESGTRSTWLHIHMRDTIRMMLANFHSVLTCQHCRLICTSALLRRQTARKYIGNPPMSDDQPFISRN